MASIKTKILVVDDDRRLRDLLGRYLTEQDFSPVTVADGAAMDKALTREDYDLLVLDLMLPGEDGLSICRRLRGAGNTTPIIILTAKGDEIDRIIGLELGADDYLPKPFNPRELVARIKAIMRRHPRAVPGTPQDALITFGPFRFDLAARTLSHGDDTLPLTTGEFALLSALVTHPRQPLSRDKLMKLARGRDYDAMERSIDVQVSRLRRLLGSSASGARYIQTVWGHGYVFVPDGNSP